MRKNSTLPEEIHFESFKYPESSNYFLLAPENVFPIISSPNSPVFNCSVEVLESTWRRMISQQKRIKLRSSSEKKKRYHYLCKTFLCRFSDYLVVQFFPVGEQQSTLLMYSYSVYGYYDFGCNRSRVYRFLIQLKKTLNKIT